ncbi:MAG: hypothetical protein AB7L09_12735 [Nitrospira sp.]
MKENFHERHEGVTLAADGLFHDKVLLVLPQSSTAVDDEQCAMRLLHRLAVLL